MKFYYYVYLRAGKVTIHRADCPFCRKGKGLQRKIFKDANGFWNGPFPDYKTVADRASEKACEIKVVPGNCKHCRPALSVRSVSADNGDEPVKQHATMAERNGLSRPKQLHEKHATEQQQLTNFYQNIQELMQERHRSEQEFVETNALGLEIRSTSVRQHAQQVAELAEAQRVSYLILEEKQAREKADLLQVYTLSE